MKLQNLVRALFLLALPLAVCNSGSAASLQGQVTAIVDGDSFTLVSQKLPVRIRLLAVAVPEGSQAYAGVARQHLSDLILNKYVVVRYSALQDFLIGQVLMGDMDIGAQMIRDGVAWYDKSDERMLSETERQLYALSMDAARNEHRGLWQDAAPVAPWDYRNAQPATVKLNDEPVTVAPETRAKRKPRGLSSEDLMGGVIKPGSMTGRPNVRPISNNGSPGRWSTYEPADHHFSILAPSDGAEISYPVLDTDGNSVDIHYVMGNNGGTFYLLLWGTTANAHSTDASASAEALDAMLSGINQMTARAGVIVTAIPGRSLKLNGYVGRQYSLEAGPASGTVRILSKQIGATRELFLMCVLNGPESNSSGAEFLNSFQIRGASEQKAVSSKQ
jgi:endonuclease YncB( thermonuclease family)